MKKFNEWVNELVRYSDDKGKQTRWLSEPPTKNELNSLSISQLITIAKQKRGFKTILVDFLSPKN
jgi:hypothetical protein